LPLRRGRRASKAAVSPGPEAARDSVADKEDTMPRNRPNAPGRILVTAFILCCVVSGIRAEERMTIGISPSLTATLNVVAEKMGFFAKEGLKVELRNVGAGNFAVALMLRGEIDVSESTVFALVANSFTRNDFRIFATTAVSGNDNSIVARKNRGIREVRDLKGRTIGVLASGFPEYVLDLMLLKAGLTSSEVRIVKDEPEKLERLFIEGKLDAVCCFGAWVDRIRSAVPDDNLVFHDDRLVRVAATLAARRAKLDLDPEAFQKLLRAHVLAEEFVAKNPDRALETVVEYFGLDPIAAREAWKPNLFHVRLDQSMIRDMENMVQWQIDTGRQKAVAIPDILDFFDFGPLEKLDPKRVTIIH
jgi:NitT/TauT family transport system substrate-binding protein